MPPVQLAITLGDPAGIGPEVVAGALAEPLKDVELTLIGPSSLVTPLKPWGRPVTIPGDPFEPGKPGNASARAALAALDRACDLALGGQVQGLVTAPVSKQHIVESGTPFTGHTEFLAARCGVRSPVMMFVGERWRAALATTHVPLRRLPQVLTAAGIADVLKQSDRALRQFFGVAEPRVAVCGLNPHAGEGGTLGREEIDVIAPAMELASSAGVRCEGPFAADTVWRRPGFDAVVAMYHDQALPVLKTLDPLAVNVTLGLPFIRTSPDHGTAFDIAGCGKADSKPMRRAIELAVELCRLRQTS